MQIRMLQLSKEKYLIFYKFHLILICLFIPKMKKIVTKYNVMSSAIVIISALRVKF